MPGIRRICLEMAIEISPWWMPTSLRLQAVQSPIIPMVGELIRQNPGVISLGQGVVSYGPPRGARQKLEEFFSDPENHKYKPVHGIAPLLERIESKLRSENGLALDGGSRLVVTAGGNMAFLNAALAIADPGDEFILQTPYYFNHEMAITMANCRAVLAPTDEQYQLRPEAIAAAITGRTRAVVTISPNNPTGAVYPAQALRQVNALCRERGVYHIHDEAYEYFTYGGAQHFSPGAIDGSQPHTISLFSLSKAYGFASWRIGYMVVPDHLFDPIRKIQDTVLICPPVISQFAAIGALQAGRPYCQEHLRIIEQVRMGVRAELRQIEHLCSIPPASGAFYFFLKVKTDLRDMELVERLIREHGVAVIPGSTFGMDQGCYLRIAYGALTPQTAAEGIGRFVHGIRAILESGRP